jgi:predicted transcriptional regulator
MRPLKVSVSITLDEDLVEKVKLLAEEDDRSFSQYINMVLKTHLEQQKQNKT